MPLSDGVKAVFFDLDDTLCAYWDAVRYGLKKTWSECGHEDIEPREFVQAWAKCFRAFCPSVKTSEWHAGYLVTGKPTRDHVMALTLEELDRPDEELAEILGNRYALARNEGLRLFEGAEALLASLVDRFPLGLITNGPADIQSSEVDVLGIRPYFQTILIEGEFGIGKPDQRIFCEAEARCGYSGTEVIFVGNSYAHDVIPAIEAGWRTIWVSQDSDVPPSAEGQNDAPERIPEGAPYPDAIARSVTEIIRHFS